MAVLVENCRPKLFRSLSDLSLDENYVDKKWLSQRAVLAPKNVAVNAINDKLLQRLKQEEKVYQSMDCITEAEEKVYYTTEVLNSLEPSGVPPHKLSLKVTSPIMLLRNLNPPQLVNGTRLVVRDLLSNVIVATILGGKHDGETVLIPRIHFTPDKSEYPFSFRRTQFPVRLAFAMTINKSQGRPKNIINNAVNQSFSINAFQAKV